MFGLKQKLDAQKEMGRIHAWMGWVEFSSTYLYVWWVRLGESVL